MRWRLFGLLLAVAVFPSNAAADSVLVLSSSGHASRRQDPFLTMPATTPAPAQAVAGASARRRPRKTVISELSRMQRSGAIGQQAYRSDRAVWYGTLATEHRLHGTRATELGGVIQNLRDMAASGALTPSRLRALFLTVLRNRQWWSRGPLLSSGQRVEFSGSQLAWEYYAGQGIELTELGNFGKADGLYTAGRYSQMRSLLGELIPLAASRSGALTWEYYFRFEGGRPPWTSAMSQGTAIEALTRAALSLGTQPAAAHYLGLAHQALAVFTRRPPTGVAVPTSVGERYLQYSFAPSPRDDVLNGFLQSLIGLYDYSQASGDGLAASLFTAGDAEARSEVPHFDTGAWSLYQPGQEDPLSYHELVTGFLQQLCQRTGAPVYCSTAQHFQSYLTTPPSLSLLTSHLRARRRGAVYFELSKISHVGIVMLRGTQTAFSTSATFRHGTRAFLIPLLRRKGTYTVRLAATDLAGNFSRTVGTLQVR